MRQPPRIKSGRELQNQSVKNVHTQLVQRCAIYTRVSTEHGLEMEFNSLHAQREACEAYITSQKHEGWQCLPLHYNDGGFSGGSLERPDLQRLILEIKAGKIDIIVVYKVDRLTRSLADFAKLVELFDAHKVSFVSVTQSFNTTSSMGRLTLNVLLSFAQFEREVTGERIRDKIAASKKKGIRMGGPVPLGYALKDKKLVVNDQEAASVRTIFKGYLEQGSLTRLMRHLNDLGIITKRTSRKDGSLRGGVRFGKGSLAYLLRNRVYIGEIIHKGNHFPAEHPPIIDRSLFDAVQHALNRSDEQVIQRRNRTKLNFAFSGRIVDDNGNSMTPTIARKNGAHYRYYVSSALAQGRHAEAGSIARISAQEIETIITNKLTELLPAEDSFTASPDSTGQFSMEQSVCLNTIERVTVSRTEIKLIFKPTLDDSSRSPLTIKWSPSSQRRKRVILQPTSIRNNISIPARPIRSETRARLLLGIAKARHWLKLLITDQTLDTKAIALQEGCSERSVRQNLNLAFLPPEIVKAAINGTLQNGAGMTQFADAGIVWGIMQSECDQDLSAQS